ncbi:MAG: hypothetical protein Tsb009_39400 [Planctomycetaceae bacterium]
MALFETSTTLNSTILTVFEFMIRPANLVKIAPPEAKLAFLDPPETLGPGCRFEFQVSGVGPVQQIEHEIIQFEHPRSFTELQIRGPLRAYQHEHIFHEQSNGSIQVIDRIEFEPPGGLAGFLINENWIRNSLQAGFEYRQRELKRLLESSE